MTQSLPAPPAAVLSWRVFAGRSRALTHVLRLVIVAAVATSLVGCGNSDPPPTPTPDATSATATGAEPTSEPSATEPSTTGTAAATSTSAGDEASSQTRWLGKVPYDVFYDRPVEMVGTVPELGAMPTSVAVAPAATSTTVAAASPATTAAATASDADSTDPPPLGGESTAARWQQVIPGDLLDEEAKLIRTRLAANLQTTATYNNSIDATSTDTIVLAALAGIGERTAADLRWKDRAPIIRTLSYDVWSAVGQRGGKAFRGTQAPFETLKEAMDGARVDVEAEAGDPFGDYADRGSLMVRIEQGFNWLRNEVPTEARLKDPEIARSVKREASVLAAMGEVNLQPSYEYVDEPEYAESCHEFVAAALALRDAAELANFEGYRTALKRVETQCGVCHGRYRVGGGGL